jgi:2-methylcitrate dehydratase PrpD
MAAGRLLELNVQEMTRALGIAGTLTAGSLEYLADGAWTKRLNPGWAGHSGIVAALLAGEGFTGPATVFEGRLGVLTSFTDHPQPELLLAGLGEDFQIMGVSVKPYACCRYNHGLIDCVLALREEHNLTPEAVESMRLGVLKAGALLVAQPIEQKQKPQNVVDAQFSAPFAASIALVYGAAGYSEYTHAHVADPAVRALMLRTDCYQDPALDAAYPELWPAAVQVRLRNGDVLTKQLDYPRGDPENPVSAAELVRKFSQLAEGLIPGDAAATAKTILSIDAATPVRMMMRRFVPD